MTHVFGSFNSNVVEAEGKPIEQKWLISKKSSFYLNKCDITMDVTHSADTSTPLGPRCPSPDPVSIWTKECKGGM